VGFTAEDLQAAVGRRFPGGEYTVHAWLLAEPPRMTGHGPQVAHPLFAWMPATGAMGVTWDELFTLFGAAAAASDGPVFGEHETTLHRPMQVGATYRVNGSIVSAEGRVGRRTGVFDVVGYLMDPHSDDDHVSTCWNSIVFPRRDA